MSTSDYVHYQDWKGWNGKPFGIYSKDQAVYFSEELRKSGIERAGGKTILEIGFGNGEFAGWARNAGANYHGTEFIDALVAKGASAGFSTHGAQKPLDMLLGEQSFDLIVAFDVFEHLEEGALRVILTSAYSALRPSGRLIVRVPSGDSPFSRAIQHGDSTHRMIIGSSMVGPLANDAGFTVDCVREPTFPLLGLGLRVFLRRAMVVALRKSAFALITRAFMGGGQPVLTPNMVFVLVKP